MWLAHFHALLAITLALGTASAADDLAQFTGLGDLPGGLDRSEVRAISADGRVVVGTSYSNAGAQAFRWTRSDGMEVLSQTPCHAFDVSADGSVVVGCLGHDRFAAGSEAFRWTQETGLDRLGRLTGGTTSQANGVSADGGVVVGVSRDSEGAGQAFRWTASEGIAYLDNRQGGEALAVSANGAIAVGTAWHGVHEQSLASSPGAHYWDNASAEGHCLVGASTSLRESFANGTTPDGSVIVGSCECDAVGFPVAFRWCQGRGKKLLGILPGGRSSSKATAVSADGAIVVGTSSIGRGYRAFVWEETHGMHNLQELLVRQFGLGDRLKGWRLLSAKDVSADGGTIVGRGINPDGDLEGWIAVLPRRVSFQTTTNYPTPLASARLDREG